MRYQQQINKFIFILGFILATVVGGVQWRHLTALPNNPAAPPSTSDTPLVIRIYYDDLKDLGQLQAYDVWEFNNLAEKYVLAAVDTAGYQSLIRQGWTVTVEPDAAELYLRSAAGDEAFYNGYRTVDELYADLEYLNTNVPDLTELVVYGQSHCLAKGGCTTLGGDVLPGYPLQAFRITNEGIPGSSNLSGQSISQGTKPVFFLMANIHSREITTPELAMRLGGYPVTAFFDTGNPGSLELTRSTREALQHKGLLQLTDVDHVYGSYQAFRRAEVSGLRHADMTLVDLRNLSFTEAKVDRIGLGYQFLKHYISVWDYQGRTLTLLRR